MPFHLTYFDRSVVVPIELTRVGVLDPVAAMHTGLVTVQGVETLGAFGEPFPPPPLNRVIEPNGLPRSC